MYTPNPRSPKPLNPIWVVLKIKVDFLVPYIIGAVFL